MPADAEIVLEGFIPVQNRVDEGPFGEFTGYYGSERGPRPIIEVKAIYFRDDPIILGAPPSKPPGDATYFKSLIDTLTNAGVPDVKGAGFLQAGGGVFIAVVSIKQRYPGHARQAGLIAAVSQSVHHMGRYVIVVDDDIDPTDPDDVLWAIATRSDPKTDIHVIDRTLSGELDPMAKRIRGVGDNTKAVIDACRPFESLKEFPSVVEASKALHDEIMEKWGSIWSK
jgi:UbiD family decarboxylase